MAGGTAFKKRALWNFDNYINFRDVAHGSLTDLAYG
jgi:hypothetical protein